MKYTTLPNSHLRVSKICLGTMTWGEQNTIEEAHKQIDFALSKGVNFWDTAEMYPVPHHPKTYNRTEEYIGEWFRKNNQRSQIILATKIVGKAPFTNHIRKDMSFSAETLRMAVAGSLKRLQTDYIDLYQLHWPERDTNFFGQLDYTHNEADKWEDNFLTCLEALNQLVKEGKIRHYGLSNETPWGTMKYLQYIDQHNLKPISTVQNPYSLLNRMYEVGMAEIGHRENIGLLAYSPLGFGRLTGKYQKGRQPEKGRLTLFPNFARYNHEQTIKATDKYCELAAKHHLSPTQLALAFVNTRPFLTSNIIGATNLEQLAENIDSIHLNLSAEILDEINKIHKEFSNPAP